MSTLSSEELALVEAICAEGIAEIERADMRARASLHAPMPEDIVDWMEAHCYLPPEVSPTRPGPLRLDNLQKGVFRALQEPGAEWVSFQKPPRFGATVGTACALLYKACHEVVDVFYTERDQAPLQAFFDKFVEPILTQSPDLAHLKRPAGTDKWWNTILDNGAALQLRSASTDGAFRQLKADLLVLDEVSAPAYQAGKAHSEGDKPSLAWARATEFRNPVMFLPSTPTEEGQCIVSREYARSDQRVYEVPCPHCGTIQQLLPKVGNGKDGPGLKFSLDDRGRLANRVDEHGHVVPDIWYECMACEEPIREASKSWMIEKGSWRATATPAKPGLVGFYTWAAYSQHPQSTWTHIAHRYLAMLADPTQRQAFVNLTLAQPWAKREQRVVPVSELEARAETYPSSCPQGVKLVTWGMDNQRGSDDGTRPARGEVVFSGWGFGEESWVLGHFVIEATPFSERWAEELYALVDRPWVRPDGTAVVAFTGGVDCGYDWDHGVRFCHMPESRKRRIRAMKGENTRSAAKTTVAKPSQSQANPLWSWILVNKQQATTVLNDRLRLAVAGPGRIHTPKSLPATFYEGLTAYRLMRDKKTGATWWQKDKDGSEIYDCWIYAYAVLLRALAEHVQIRPLIMLRPAGSMESGTSGATPYTGPDRSANGALGAEAAAARPAPAAVAAPAAPTGPVPHLPRPDNGTEAVRGTRPPQRPQGQQARTWGRVAPGRGGGLGIW